MKPLALFLLYSIALCAPAQEPATLRLIKTIPLPGVKGRFDHFAIDVKGRRLFVAALGNNTLEVADAAAGKRLQSITGLHKPTGVVYLPSSDQIGVANGDDGTLRFYSGTSYSLASTLGSLDDADNLRIDQKSKLIFLGFGDGALAVIDPATMKQTRSIKLSAHPESFQLEPQGNRIFVNVPDAKQVVVLDRTQMTALARWPMTKFTANFPMALDGANRRLFIGCRQPARLVVFDTANGKSVTDLAISGDTDDLFYDAKLKRLYLSCGEGFIDVIGQRDADTYQMRERISTRVGARTSFFSGDLNEFYLAVPMQGEHQAEIRVFQPQS